MKQSAVEPSPAEWQKELGRAVRDPAELCRLVGLSSATVEAAAEANQNFPILAPRPYIARIRPGDPNDPLLMQVLPSRAEMQVKPGFSADPLGESAVLCGPGLLWKYQNRILILTTPACVVHCRFCFRRHFPVGKSGLSPSQWGEVAEKIASEQSIHEIILSGGDPLILSDEELSEIANKLGNIKHLRRLRIHSRLPIMIPDRICDEFIAWIKSSKLTISLVVHINHPAEIDAAVASALGQLIDAGITVLSQGVLLAGINDNLETLAELYERLADIRVMPYYLHQLDAVAGAAHFEVSIDKGRQLITELRRRLPGYAVPRYVRETPGGPSKEILC